jgi:hypothetical protein
LKVIRAVAVHLRLSFFLPDLCLWCAWSADSAARPRPCLHGRRSLHFELSGAASAVSGVHAQSQTSFRFQECAECKVRDTVKSGKVKRDEEDDESGEYQETVTFNREPIASFANHAHDLVLRSDLCSKCGHVICEHFYSFQVSQGHTRGGHLTFAHGTGHQRRNR